MKPGDLLLVLLANTAWAFNFIVGKAGVSHFQPFLFTSLRFAVLLLVLLPFLRWLPGRMGGVLGIALVQGVIHFSLIFAGLKASGDIASVAIASQLYVPFSTLLAVVFLGERLGRRRLFGMASAFGGVLVIGLDPLVFNHLDALLLITAGALAMAVATIQMRRLQGVGVFALQGWIALCATPALAALSLLFEDGQWAAVRSATLRELATPVYSALAASLIGHGIVYFLLGRYPVGVVTPLLLLSPVLAVAFGVLLWGDVLTWKLILGGILTLAGIAIITVPVPHRAAPSG
ncbi:MAG: EamA family transporter [Candidatus Competibacteraceae bacterium]|nr:EamA family transporter [Candidatus Competibacteraceae bacterium]MBK8896147.1 EamA family transporter [Candidatus Competibacteraceae bacterium]MBK9950326.1 EamA family transporter [Candidatus Competibacteraceae bacterium]